MNDVLNIVECIKKKHSEAENVKSCSGAIRRFFRFAGKNSGALKTLLGFAPDDIYGSVITGGLTMIVGAIERADKLRGDIYSAAADIPLQMMGVRELLRPYSTRMDAAAELHRRADLVFLAVFDVLFALVNEVTKNLGSEYASVAGPVAVTSVDLWIYQLLPGRLLDRKEHRPPPTGRLRQRDR